MRLVLAALLGLSCLVAPTHACHTYSIPDTDEQTEGPYWTDAKLNRINITEGQAGVPFILNLRVLDKQILGNACGNTANGVHHDAPLTTGIGAMNNVQVDIWHTNAAGAYSGFAAENTVGLTWMRGYQRTNATGQVTFHTIYPGYYPGRATHIHVRIRVYDDQKNQIYNDATQIYFDDTFSDSIFTSAASLYDHGTRTVRNTNDGGYIATMKMNVVGDITKGLSGDFNLYYPFGNVPIVITTNAPGTTDTPTTSTPSTTATATGTTTSSPTTTSTTSSSTGVSKNAAPAWLISPCTWLMSAISGVAALLA